MGRKITINDGGVFGRLKVLHRLPIVRRKRDFRCYAHFSCECLDCGFISTHSAQSLKKAVHGCPKCLYKARSTKTRIKSCETCSSDFLAPHPYTARFCSYACHNKRTLERGILEAKNSVEGTLSRLIYGIRSRSGRKKIACDIDKDFVIQMYRDQGGKCAATGIELKPSLGAGYSRKVPELATIDRIDSSKGYTKDNVRIVCYMYNMAKSSFSDTEVYDFCKRVVENGNNF